VHILASDVATTGLAPRFMTVDLNLPRTLGDDDLEALWEAYHRACADAGITVVTGHTGRYDGCDWPMVGGANCMALGEEGGYVVPTMARPGDLLVVTKGAAIEATALFAATFPERLAHALGERTWRAADALFEGMTVVPEARIAADYGLHDDGVSAMHDATEGGVLGGILELAEASGTGLRVDLEAVPVRPEVRAVCAHIGIDPYRSISEGTLVLAVRAGHVDGLVGALRDGGVDAAVVGELTPDPDGRVLEVAGTPEPLRPVADPFWEAFGRWTAAAPGQ
jgi:hydrogenase expression/formation protein HypE